MTKPWCISLLVASSLLIAGPLATAATQIDPPTHPTQALPDEISPDAGDLPDEALPDGAVTLDAPPLAAAAPLSAQAFISQDRDIGAVAVAGSATSDSSGTFTIHGSGADIWGTADEFHFVYIQLSGDIQIVARVTGVEFTDGWAKAGLMARETLDANSRNFMVFVTPQNLSAVQWRATTGGNSDYIDGGAAAIPQWIKLVRTGNSLSGYRSADAVNWTLIGSMTISLPSSVYVGMAVTSHKDGTLCTATFDNVTQSSGGGGGGTGVPSAPTNLQIAGVSSNSISLTWTDTSANETAFLLERSTDGSTFQARVALNQNTTSFTDFAVVPGTHYWFRVVATNNAGRSLPSNVADATTTGTGFQGQDIGAVGAPGRFVQTGQDEFSVFGSGEDIYGTSDEFFFVYIPMTGDFTAIVKASHLDNTNPWAKAGLMARASLAANAANAIVFRNPAGDAGMQWRSAAGGNTTFVPGGSAQLGEWLKLTREGNTFTAYKSTEPGTFVPPTTHFELIGSVTISMPSSIFVGMPVTSHADGILANAGFGRLTIFSTTTPPTGLPAAPSGLLAEAVSPTSISLTWTDNATNETGFEVVRSINGPGGTFSAVASLGANSTSYLDTGLTPSTQYWYAVRATNNVGSASSPLASAITPGSGGGTAGWQDQDIGAVSAAGSFGQSGNTFTVGGSGYDIWDNNDEFHYGYQIGTNNVQIVARITGMANTSPWAKAGVMIRNSLSPGAANVLLALTPAHGLAFQWRSVDGGQTSYIDAGSASAPVWVKLVKTADTITGYRSSDGINWTQVASVTASINSSTFPVGLAVTSHFDGQVCIANFDNVTITGTTGGGGGGGVPAVPSGLTATPHLHVSPDAWEILLAWTDNSTNETGFVVERSTNGTTFVQIAFVPSPQAGMSDSAIAPGVHYWYRVAATNSAGRSPYSNVAEATAPTGGGGGVPTAPTDLTATVSGTQINLVWRDTSTNETGFVLERSIPFGTFQQVALLAANTQAATDNTGTPGSTYWYRIAATNNAGLSPYSNIAETRTPSLPPPWETLAFSSGGSASLANGVFSITASSGDIFGTSDSFNFAYQPVSGDQTIIASIDGLDLVSGALDAWARVGLMIRETLSPSAKNAMVFLSAQHGTGFTWREATGGSTQYIPGGPSVRFLKLTRTGNTFSAYSSADGQSWQLIGSATINMASSVYIGLAVTSHGYGSEVRGRFSQVSLSGGGGGGGGSLPAPWQNQDVGAVGVAGSASFSQGAFTVQGDGYDIWGNADAFHYAYLTISGNGQLVARVTAIQNTAPWAKAGLMVRGSSLADAPNVLVMATADHGTGLQWRSSSGGGSSYVPGPFWTAPLWLRLQRQDSTITGSTSLDGVNWTTVGTQTIAIGDPVLIGLAVTSHDNSGLNTSMFDNVTFTPQ